MSNEKPAEKNPNSPLVPVKVVRFVRDIDIPGRGLASAINGAQDKSETSKSWKVDFDRSIRHHRIAYYPPGKKEPERVVYVPAEQVSSWDPA